MKKTSKETIKKRSGIIPLGDRVLIRPMTVEEVDSNRKGGHFGIIIPDAVSKEKSAQGIVLGVGPGKYIEGKLIQLGVKVGDKVVFSRYSYDDVSDGVEDLYLVREDNILAIIKG
ncbi:MAG: chaperonin GroES [Parcubacteria bacterium C7867-005]|nr:MAG: chaperonin GroES [Parcubacteria bacterium C7867-005]